MSVRDLKPMSMPGSVVPAGYARYPYHLTWCGRLVAAFGSRSMLPEPQMMSVFTFIDGVSHDVDFVRWVSRSLPGERARDFTLYVFDAGLRLSSCYVIDEGWVAITHQWHPSRRPRSAVYYHLLTLHYQHYARHVGGTRAASLLSVYRKMAPGPAKMPG